MFSISLPPHCVPCCGIMHLSGLLIAVTQLSAVNNSFWVFKFSSFHFSHYIFVANSLLLFFVVAVCLFVLFLLWFFCCFCKCCFISSTTAQFVQPGSLQPVLWCLSICHEKPLPHRSDVEKTKLMGNGIRTQTKGFQLGPSLYWNAFPWRLLAAVEITKNPANCCVQKRSVFTLKIQKEESYLNVKLWKLTNHVTSVIYYVTVEP